MMINLQESFPIQITPEKLKDIFSKRVAKKEEIEGHLKMVLESIKRNSKQRQSTQKNAQEALDYLNMDDISVPQDLELTTEEAMTISNFFKGLPEANSSLESFPQEVSDILLAELEYYSEKIPKEKWLSIKHKFENPNEEQIFEFDGFIRKYITGKKNMRKRVRKLLESLVLMDNNIYREHHKEGNFKDITENELEEKLSEAAKKRSLTMKYILDQLNEVLSAKK